MDRFSFDVEELVNKFEAPTKYRLADVQDRLEKVAFDVVRFRDDDDSTRLWQIQDTPEGKVIIAIYNENGEKKSESDWKAIPDRKAGVQIFHKGEPMVRLAAKNFGIPEEDIGLLCRWLPKKLAEDVQFRNDLMSFGEAETISNED